MRFHILAAGLVGVLTLSLGGAAASAGTTPMTTELIASGLQRPVGMDVPQGDYSRIFVIEKAGRVRVIQDGVLLGTPFLDINSLVGGGTSEFNEQGLLGIALHPDYLNNGYMYLNYTNNSGNTTLVRYTALGDPATSNVGNAGSAQTLFVISQPFSNHNGGWLGFSPIDGYLYMSTGDGGSGNDPGNRAQNLNNALGKMLRIDVDGGVPYAIPEDNPYADGGGDARIWHYGLRNAWRCAFDRETGDLYIGDVGQSAKEEISFQRFNSAGNINYGWRCMEGNNCTGLSGCTCFSSSLTDPILEYTHAFGCSVTGGEIYRGCAMPDMQALYFYADYCSDIIWTSAIIGGIAQTPVQRQGELDPPGGAAIQSIGSFGKDNYGEIYIVDQGTSSANGELWKIVPASGSPFFDCNSNGIEDGCEISDGSASDEDGNGIPDVCDVPALDVVEAGQTATSIAIEMTGNPDLPYAIRVNGDANNDDVSCVDAYVQEDGTLGPAAVNRTLEEWGSPVTIEDTEIIPEATYTVSTEGFPSSPVDITTLLWGDVNNNEFVNLEDVQLAIIDFQNSTYTEAADVDPCEGNDLINLADALVIVNLWQLTSTYVSSCGSPCGG
ncbi:MAG: PQQ-dependent sugar dehydrogenase [Planctomycetota bacterium]